MTYRSKVAAVYLLGFFLDLINMFIASVAFPAMAAALDASPATLAWVSNGYIAGLTLVIPFSASLTRAIGARQVMILSLSLFTLAGAAAGLSTSLEGLIAWRVVQGMGGGLLIPTGQALTWQLFAPRERARLSSLVMMIALLAPAASPAAGGLLVQSLGWRWIFFATLPVAALTLLLALVWLKNDEPLRLSGRWLHLPLLANPLLRFSMLVYLCVPGMFIGVNLVGMFYLQSVVKLAPALTGALMLPWSAASFAAIMATGKLFNRTGPRPLILTGCLLQAAGIASLTLVGAASSHGLLIVAFALMGAGGSLCSSAAQSCAFLTISHDDMPDASALWNLNRQLSFFAGATLLTLLLGRLQQHLTPPEAWRSTFFIAAAITLIPAVALLKFNNQRVVIDLQKEKQ